jgi:hypothetical protein
MRTSGGHVDVGGADNRIERHFVFPEHGRWNAGHPAPYEMGKTTEKSFY